MKCKPAPREVYSHSRSKLHQMRILQNSCSRIFLEKWNNSKITIVLSLFSKFGKNFDNCYNQKQVRSHKTTLLKFLFHSNSSSSERRCALTCFYRATFSSHNSLLHILLSISMRIDPRKERIENWLHFIVVGKYTFQRVMEELWILFTCTQQIIFLCKSSKRA